MIYDLKLEGRDTIPGFHHSTVPGDAAAGARCTNKANWAAWPIAPNKPNSPEAPGRDKYRVEKELQRIVPAQGLGETKPISRLRIGDWGQICGGTPALRPVASDPRGPVVQTNPIGRSQSCKTKPIPGGTGWDGATGAWDAGQSCKTRPISPAGTGRARRGAARWAQVPHPSTIPSFQDSIAGPAPEGESCKTNPICEPPTAEAAAEPVDSVPVRALGACEARRDLKVRT
jgi:hypothetical protein